MHIKNAQRYLPHRPPFIMIDDVRFDPDNDRKASASFIVAADNVLVRDGKLTAGGLVENMAQAAGAATVMRTAVEGKEPGLGFIGALKNLKVVALPGVGESLQTRVTFVHQVLSALIVEAQVSASDRLLASCELKIFLQS